MSRSLPADTEQKPPRIGALLRLAWQQIRERIDKGVRNKGYEDLNRAHLAMFRYEGLDGLRPTQIAEQMQITKQSVNELLRHLEGQGYIRLRPDPADSRARLIRLTPLGRKLENTIRDHAGEAERELIRILGGPRFHQFQDTLVKIAGLGGLTTRDTTVQPQPGRTATPLRMRNKK
jgi:DNA-binding MarR family transcriptional regulator